MFMREKKERKKERERERERECEKERVADCISYSGVRLPLKRYQEYGTNPYLVVRPHF